MKNSVILNKYQIIKKIGEGAYGYVYLVQDIKDKRVYALKSIKTNRKKYQGIP